MIRESISNRKRFAVFDRDFFTCQYCGRSAPNAVLECDHIIAVANGGTNCESNLITSCRECNSGKTNKQLDPLFVEMKSKRVNMSAKEVVAYFVDKKIEETSRRSYMALFGCDYDQDQAITCDPEFEVW